MATPSTKHDILRAPKTLRVTSTAFPEGKAIPREHTGHGDDVSPPLTWPEVPGARAYAIIVDDPDAPRATFTHWTAWDLPIHALPRGADVARLGGVEGTNDFGTLGYRGPQPPSGTHRYHFHVFALKGPLGLPKGAKPAEVWRALEGNVLAWGETVGTFGKP